MSAEEDEALPRWGGVAEPMTVFTDTLLAAVAFVLAARLGLRAAVEGVVASSVLAGGLLATAFAAVLGAVSHGADPRTDADTRKRFWRAALYASGLVGVASIASVAFFAARGPIRTAILVFAGLKLAVYVVSVARRPEFRVAAADYGGALAILLVGAVYAMARWRSAGAPWLIAGVAVSLVAGLVQARRVALHRHFNHNDLFHVIQVAALYLFYRGGVLLVDR
jgi:hypothetical protein